MSTLRSSPHSSGHWEGAPQGRADDLLLTRGETVPGPADRFIATMWFPVGLQARLHAAAGAQDSLFAKRGNQQAGFRAASSIDQCLEKGKWGARGKWRCWTCFGRQ